MTATTSYPYTERELERTARELERILGYALWAVTHRDAVDNDQEATR